jgi:hypothetical protein
MPPIRKLEYFEDQLKTSPLGKEVLALMRTHSKEVMYLVNHNRPTMVCWQRNKGPQFIKSVVDSGFEEETNFIKEAAGIKMETIILQMAEVLQDNGTPELKRSISKYTLPVLQMARECNSLREVIQRVNNTQTA